MNEEEIEKRIKDNLESIHKLHQDMKISLAIVASLEEENQILRRKLREKDTTMIETGQDMNQRSLQQIIIAALKNHPMTKSDLRKQINCPDEIKFEKAMIRLIADAVIFEQYVLR